MTPGARGGAIVIVAATALSACGHAGATAPVVPAPSGDWVVVPNVRPVAQAKDDDCGPTALATALGRWNVKPARSDLERPPGEGVTAGALRDEARRLGFASFVFEGSLEDLTTEVDDGRPVIVGLVRVVHDGRFPHFAVVVGHDVGARHWLVVDPALGVERPSAEALRTEWARSGWVTLVMAPRAKAQATP